MARRLATVVDELDWATRGAAGWREMIAETPRLAWLWQHNVEEHEDKGALLDAEALALIAAASDSLIARWLQSPDPRVRAYVALHLNARPVQPARPSRRGR